MFENRSRGPKPSKWTKESRVAFDSFFARRTGALDPADAHDRPLDVGGPGNQWLFGGKSGDEPTQVRSALGGRVINVVTGVIGALVTVGTGDAPGVGTCERYYVLGEKEVARRSPRRACAAAPATSPTVRLMAARTGLRLHMAGLPLRGSTSKIFGRCARLMVSYRTWPA